MSKRKTRTKRTRRLRKFIAQKKLDLFQRHPVRYWLVKMFLIALTVLAILMVFVAVIMFREAMNNTAQYTPLSLRQQSPLEKEIREMVSGYPIEDMAPYIASQDPTVAAFLVSIAKKESNWGKRVPVLDGRDCYNYWGYRGKSEEMGTGGHTCFKDKKEAVDTVAKRIETLALENRLDTPAEMIVWKCGYNCAGHSEQSVNKWISDVAFYFKKFHTDDDGRTNK